MGPSIAAAFVAGAGFGAASGVLPGTAAALAIGSAAIWIGTARPGWRRTAFVLTTIFWLGALHGAAAQARALDAPLVRWFDVAAAGEPRSPGVIEIDIIEQPHV